MNLRRVQNKGEKWSYQKYDKDITVQQKKRKATLPKITSPAKMNTSEVELSDETSPIQNEEGLNDRKDDKNKKYDEDKYPECLDNTSTVDMEEGVVDRKDDSKEDNDEGKEAECPDDTPLC